MKRRVEIIETSEPVMTVSIHQNSYHEEYVHGAQTFYYANSEQSKLLAEKYNCYYWMRLTEIIRVQQKVTTVIICLKNILSDRHRGVWISFQQ